MFQQIRLCTILVHLRSRDGYYAEMRKKQDAYAALMASCGHTEAKARELAERLVWWAPWRYNDIIGFLEVVCEPSGAVLAYLYRVDAKRVSRRLVKKRFVSYGKCAEVPGDFCAENHAESIRAGALDCIAQATHELTRKGWHVDAAEATAFLRCGRFDEFLSTLEKQPQSHKPAV